jgi:hypothetical protein
LPIFQRQQKEIAMEGVIASLGLSEDEAEAARAIFAQLQVSAMEELARLACLLAAKPTHQLFGQTEFEVRDSVHRVGAQALTIAANQRRKKGGTSAAASSVRTAGATRSSSAGAPRRW